jgi:hypothetical protein
MSNLVSVHLEMVLVSIQDKCIVCVKCTIGLGIVLDHPMVQLGDEAQLKAHLVCLEIVLILMRDRCTVCAERTIGSEIVLDAPDRTHR